MTPYFDSGDGRVTLYCGDFLEVMRELEDGSVAAQGRLPLVLQVLRHAAQDERNPLLQADGA